MAVLYIQTAFLGDLCLASPTLKRIRTLRPSEPIHLVCRKGFGSMMKSVGLVDHVHEVEKGNPRSYRTVLDQLNGISWEWIFCPHESWTSAQFQFSLRAQHKVGFKRLWNGVFFDQRVKKPAHLPEALRQMSLLGAVDAGTEDLINGFDASEGALVPAWADPTVAIPWNPALLQRLHLEPQRAIIFPGSVWETKKWTEQGFVEVAQAMAQQDLQVVLMGSSSEKELCDRIGRQVPVALNLAGATTLLESLQILQGAQIVISNDSGGQHLASLAGTPTVTIFGPTVPSQGFRPWNARAQIVEIPDLGCRPCGKHGHNRCPRGTHECMTHLPSSEVIEAVLRCIPSH